MNLSDIFEPLEATGEIDAETEDSDDNVTHVSDGTDDLEPQSIPSDSKCPYCGGEPTDESQVEHRLSAIGYMHDDIDMQCSDCDRTWACGVPIGESDGELAADLFCDSCEERYMRVHRVAPKWDDEQQKVLLHLKCPNCYYFDKTVRESGEKGIVLMGYPDITGSSDDAQAYGYPDE